MLDHPLRRLRSSHSIRLRPSGFLPHASADPIEPTQPPSRPDHRYHTVGLSSARGLYLTRMTAADTSPRRLRRDLLDRLSPGARDAVERIVAAAEPGERRVRRRRRRARSAARAVSSWTSISPSNRTRRPWCARALPGTKVTVHARFRTASVTVAGTRIDVATARTRDVRPAGRAAARRALGHRHRSAPPRLQHERCCAAALERSGDHRPDAAASTTSARGACACSTTRRSRTMRRASSARSVTPRASASCSMLTRAALLAHEPRRTSTTIGGERLRREIELMLGERRGGVALEAADAAGALAPDPSGAALGCGKQQRACEPGAAHGVPTARVRIRAARRRARRRTMRGSLPRA